MSKYYNQDDDENFGAEMLQNTLAEAKKQSTLDEALAVLDSAMATFRENTEVLDQVARTQKTFATDSAPFMETTQKLIVLLEGLSNDKIPKKAVEVINSNIKTLCEVLGKYVNSKIEESDKAFYMTLEDRDIAIKKQFNDMESLKDKVWLLFYILLTLIMGLIIFTVIILTANQLLWHISKINEIGFCSIGMVILLISGIIFIYHRSS